MSDQSMVYDARDGYVLLFGGSGSSFMNQTWGFSHGNWLPLAVGSSAPSPRDGAAMAYDSADGHVVLFGGYDYSGHAIALGDTWTYSAGHWTNLSTLSPSPPPLYFGTMTYDAFDGYALLYGGIRSNGAYSADTWKFQSGAWTNLSIPAAAAPPARAYAEMGFDPGDNETVLSGGCNSTGGGLHDTWEYRATSWTKLALPNRTAVPFDVGLADGYAPLGLPLVTYGGGPCNLSFGALQEAFAFQNQSWQGVSPINPASPPPLEGDRLAFDAADGYEVLYGGVGIEIYGSASNSTWALVPTQIAGAAISASPVSGGADPGFPVTFSAAASGGLVPYTYTWTTNMTGCGPTHLQQLTCSPGQAGVFEVQLSVKDQTGMVNATRIAAYQVDSAPALAGNTTRPSLIDVDQSVTFNATLTNVGSGGDSFTWDSLPNGCASVDLAALTCRPITAGTVHPRLFVMDSNRGIAGTTFTLIVNSDPGVVVQYNGPATEPVGTSVTFAAIGSGGTSPYNFTWGGLPGECTSVRSAQTTCVLRSPGNYLVNVSVVDALGFHNHSSALGFVVAPSPSGHTQGSPVPPTSVALVVIVGIAAIVLGVWLVRRRLRRKQPPLPSSPDHRV